MTFCKKTALVLPSALLFTALSHSAPPSDSRLFGCDSLFGSSGQKTWMVGLDLKQGNLLTTQLTTNEISTSETNFGAATVNIRNHIIGPDKTEQISAGDSLTFCRDLNISVGSQLQLHWQGQSTPQVSVQGGGESLLGCLYGHINDPFSGSMNPFIACVTQGPTQTTAYDLIGRAFKKMTTPEIKELFCDMAAKEHHLNFSVCSEKFDSLPSLYPNLVEHLNNTLPN